MSETAVETGWCFLCNTEIDTDQATHFQAAHAEPTSKPRGEKISWVKRIDNIIESLKEIQTMSKRNDQIDKLDEMTKEIYLVRARLGQERGTPRTRVKEG